MQKCFYELRWSIDQKGRPSSITQGGTVTVEIVSNDQDGPLADWMANSYQEHDGEISFQDEKNSVLKKLEFKKARCVSFTERFDKTPDPTYPDRPAMTLTMTISAEDIVFSGATHKNNWDDKGRVA